MSAKKKPIEKKQIPDTEKEKTSPDNESKAPDNDKPAPREGNEEELNPAGNKDNMPEEQTDGE
jgi:hypothetical protein